MKYKAVIMTPQVVEFDSDGPPAEITNIGWSKCLDFGGLVLIDEGFEFEPRLAAIFPIEPGVPEKVLVFDPPPQVA